MRSYARLAVLVAFATALSAGFAPSATASSGEITKALASAGWTEAEVAGSTAWSGCEHTVPQPPPKKPGPGEPPSKEEWVAPRCTWTPFVTLGPGIAASDCAAAGRRDPDALGEGVVLIWRGETRGSAGSDQFDVGGIPLDGGVNWLACLSAIEEGPAPIMCASAVGALCPPYRIASFPHALGAALLTSLSPAQAQAATSAPVSGRRGKSAKRPRRCRKHVARGRHLRRSSCRHRGRQEASTG